MSQIRVRIKWQVLRTRLYLERLPLKAFVLPTVIFGLTCMSFVSYYQLFWNTDFWQQWSVAGGNAFHFCESNHMDQLIRQPSNTWSNLAYLVVGLFALTLGVHDMKYSERKSSDNFLVRYPIFSIVFGISALYLFIGSFMFHASLTTTFQHLDQTGLYSVIVIILAFNFYKIFPLIRFRKGYRSSHGWMIVFALLFNVLIYTKLWLINVNVLFPILILIVFLTSLYYLLFVSNEHYFTNYMWAALTTLLLAGIIWLLDRTNVVCNPESIFQGHALWHILTAVSILFIYLYYRSGTVPVQYTLALHQQRRDQRLARRNALS